MSKKPEDLRAEAEEYVDGLPNETADGRLVTDDGTPADTDEWQAERDRQETTLRDKKRNQR